MSLGMCWCNHRAPDRLEFDMLCHESGHVQKIRRRFTKSGGSGP